MTGPTATEPATATRQRHGLLPLALILLLAAALRIYGINTASFWLDEFCSVETSTGRGLLHVLLPQNVLIDHPPPLTTLTGAKPWQAIWPAMRWDNHPPLYFILLRFWRDLFGESDAAARAMSVAASLMAIVFLHDALRISQFPRHVRLWSALLMAVAIPQIHFAAEARGYSLLTAFTMAACAALLRLQHRGWTWPRTIALASATLAMLLTHYYAIAPLVALALFALRGPYRWRIIITIIAAGLIFLFACGPLLLQQRKNLAVNNAYQIEPPAGHGLLTLQRAAVLPVRLLSESAAAWTPWAFAGIAAYFLPWAFFRRRPDALLWRLLFLLPILLVVAVDLIRRSNQSDLVRYSVLAGPGLYVLIAAAFSGRISAHLLPASAALLCLLALPRAYSHDMQWPLLAATLQSHAQPGDAIVFASAGRDDWYAGALYLGVSHYAPGLASPIVLLTRPPSVDLLNELHNHRTIWLLAGAPDLPPKELLPSAAIRQRLVFPDIGALYELTWPHPTAWQPSDR